ncbi:hypothetical protein GGR56DRAFT_682307 [Xylariaceae sp. FL0804]|nr:hypothetical protein GGR56DRAFT_682307 [Xylariaceae sp. FL0804]
MCFGLFSRKKQAKQAAGYTSATSIPPAPRPTQRPPHNNDNKKNNNNKKSAAPAQLQRQKQKQLQKQHRQRVFHTAASNVAAGGAGVATFTAIDLGSDKSKTDLCPIEALVLGRSEQELSKITAISGNVHMGGFKVHYENGSTRNIGPRQLAIKILRIDRRNSERIAYINVHTSHITDCIRFVTARGRLKYTDV